jgi:coenzyme F420-0:L-glutamate ligase / coenzyme F420-1:gamma-L-glutamate ligase
MATSGRAQVHTINGNRRADTDPSERVRVFMTERRSIRKYLDGSIARDVVDALLAAAITAPSAHNRQPWRFFVTQSQRTKHRLAIAMGERLRADRLCDGDRMEDIDRDVERSYARVTGAPVVVVVCMSMIDMDRYPDPHRNESEHTMAVQGTAMAAQNLLLAAHAAGLGACWMCAPLFCPDTVVAELALPSDWEPQGIVTLGHPAESGKPFKRRPISEIVRHDSGTEL